LKDFSKVFPWVLFSFRHKILRCRVSPCPSCCRGQDADVAVLLTKASDSENRKDWRRNSEGLQGAASFSPELNAEGRPREKLMLARLFPPPTTWAFFSEGRIQQSNF